MSVLHYPIMSKQTSLQKEDNQPNQSDFCSETNKQKILTKSKKHNKGK